MVLGRGVPDRALSQVLLGRENILTRLSDQELYFLRRRYYIDM